MNKTAFLLLALSISVSYVLTSPQLGLFDNLGVGLDDVAHLVVETVKNVSLVGLDGAAAGLVNSVQNVSSEIGKQAQALAVQVALALHAAADLAIETVLGTIQSVIEKLEAAIPGASSSKRSALARAQEKLKTINAAVLELKDQWASAFRKLESEKAKYLAEINEKIRNWAQHQLDIVNSGTNGSGNSRARRIITALLSRYENYIHDSIEKFVTRQAKFEQALERTLSEVNNATIALQEAIDSCLLSSTSSWRCNSAISAALDRLENAQSRLLALKKEAVEILALGLEAGRSVAAIIRAFESEKYSIIIQLYGSCDNCIR